MNIEGWISGIWSLIWITGHIVIWTTLNIVARLGFLIGLLMFLVAIMINKTSQSLGMAAVGVRLATEWPLAKYSEQWGGKE